MHLYREAINQCGLAVLEHELDSDVENVFLGGWESEYMVGGGISLILLPKTHGSSPASASQVLE